MKIQSILYRLLGLYSLFTGAFAIAFLIYNVYNSFEHVLDLSLLSIVFYILLLWLVIGGILLLKKIDIHLLGTSLILTQLVVEFLTGFSIGLFFLPVTIILTLSIIVSKLVSQVKEWKLKKI
jgi:hypothetical protein